MDDKNIFATPQNNVERRSLKTRYKISQLRRFGESKKRRSKQQAQKQLGDFHLVLVNHPRLKSRACISDLADNAKTVVITQQLPPKDTLLRDYCNVAVLTYR